jgi:hypothetical protein
MAVMGSGDIVVGYPTAAPNRSRLKDSAKDTDGLPSSKPHQQQMCGAMSQQSDHSQLPSQPQGFVRLVGYRNPKVRPPRTPS